ncbi:hypothetical protein [Streptomyces sp. NBC_00063]|nr:hypothetical protein [Streptomyces sp. NBC_00063]MCX5435749.1 hypothetical protein [Streptomyces sp. NBC_00063]
MSWPLIFTTRGAGLHRPHGRIEIEQGLANSVYDHHVATYWLNP